MTEITKFDVSYPDTWQSSEGVGIRLSKDGLYSSLAAAKASIISSIDTQIWELKNLKKEIRATKRKDIK